MTDAPIRVLLVEDNPGDARLLRETLADAGTARFAVTHAGTIHEAVVRLAREQYDVILLDLSLPDSLGLQTVSRAQLAAPRVAIVVLTGLDDEALGFEAVRAGAQDYLVKGQTDPAALARAIRYAVERKHMETERERLLAEVRSARDELERRVQNRTAELKHTVDVLQAEAVARAEAERALRETNELLKLFVTKSSRKEYLDSVVQLLRNWSGCRCVGIRLLDSQGRIPYESHVGFSEKFLQEENLLSIRTDQCACIRVVKGSFEPQDGPALSPGGSFLCNSTSRFVGGLSPAQQARFRGACVRAEFESVAIVPIRYRNEILGAIHLADGQPGKFPAGAVEFIEAMTPLIGEAVRRFSVEDALRETNELLEKMFGSIHLQVAYMDRDFNFIRVNSAYAAADEREPEFYVGKNHFALYPNEENQAIFREVLRGLHPGQLRGGSSLRHGSGGRQQRDPPRQAEEHHDPPGR